MESVGNITAACVVFSGRYLLPLISSVDWPMMQVMLTKSRATRQSQGRLQDCAQGDDDRHQNCLQTKKRLVLGEPSSHVIFLGLRPDFSEADVCQRALYIFEYRAESTLYFNCRHTCPTMDATLKQSPS
ncbi:hypothetical protein M405DRAFT_451321 [Rhizopogon salebrosus TDB-379]|nr:hypothetical protein M405DRAFT_451321 [Rhizopogon salebrosus TDB-379]